MARHGAAARSGQSGDRAKPGELTIAITLESLPYRLLRLVYFMVPAYTANMTPPFVKYWKGWNPPISRRQLGDHKTVLGFALGVCAAVVATFIQARMAWEGSIVAYEQWLPLGLRLGFGAMAGDSAKSFVKRRVGIAPGQSWVPFDQLDFVIGALVLTGHRAPLSWLDWALILAVSGAGAVVVTHLGYRLGIRPTKW